MLLEPELQPNDEAAANALINHAFATAMHATHCTSHLSLDNISPGALAFGCDMLLNMPLVANLVAIQERRQIQVDQCLVKENNKRCRHDYVVGEQVMLSNYKRQSKGGVVQKLENLWVGPFPIIQVHANGTVMLERPNGVHERVSLRLIKPFQE